MSRARPLALAALVSLAALPVAAQDLEAARAAYIAAWEAAPMTLRTSTFVTEPAKGFGIYAERPSNVFASGEPLYIYLEPEGYGFKTTETGNEFGATIDLRLLSPGGDVLFEQAGFLTLTTSSRNKVTEFFGNVTLTLTDIPSGAYVLELGLNDIASDEKASVQMPFEVQ